MLAVNKWDAIRGISIPNLGKTCLLLFPYNLYSTYRSQLSEIFHSKSPFRAWKAAECRERRNRKKLGRRSDEKTLYTIFNFEIALVYNIVHLILTKPGILGGAPFFLQYAKWTFFCDNGFPRRIFYPS